MQRNHLILHIQACSHLFRTAHQYPHFPAPHLFQQFRPFCVRVGLMYESNILFRHARTDKGLFHGLVKIKPAVRLGRPLVTEDKLGGMFLRRGMVYFRHFSGTGIELGVRVILQCFIQNAGIHGEQPCLVGQFQEIVLAAVHFLIADGLRPFHQFLHDCFLIRGDGCFHHLHPARFKLRHRKGQHIRRLNVRHQKQHGHQLRQVMELGKPGFHLVAGAFRLDFQGGLHPAECAGPCVEHEQPPAL